LAVELERADVASSLGTVVRVGTRCTALVGTRATRKRDSVDRRTVRLEGYSLGRPTIVLQSIGVEQRRRVVVVKIVATIGD